MRYLDPRLQRVTRLRNLKPAGLLERVRDLQQSKAELQEKILDLEKFEEVVVGRELKMIALEKEIEQLKHEQGRKHRG